MQTKHGVLPTPLQLAGQQGFDERSMRTQGRCVQILEGASSSLGSASEVPIL